jgi:hypothetical protein
MHIVAFAFIFVSIAQSTWSLWLMQNGHEGKSKQMDKLFVVVLPAAYLVTNVLLISGH